MKKKESGERRLTSLKRTFLLILLSMGIVLAISFAAVFLMNNAYITGKNDIYILEKQDKLDRMMESLDSELHRAEQQQLKLLADTRVQQLVYSRDEMEPYSYYRQALEIMNRMKEITDDFWLVKSLWLEMDPIGLYLNQDGPVRSLPVPEAELSAASQQSLYESQGKLYIIRSLMDYQSYPSTDLCTLILELDAPAIRERFSFLCLEDESVLLSVSDSGRTAAEAPSDENVQQVCSLSARYPLQAILKIGPTRYRLSTDEVLTQTYAVLLTVFLLAIGFLLYLYHQFYRPLELLLDEAFQHLEMGDLSYRIPEKQANRPFAGVFRTFNAATERLEYLMDHVYRQKLLISEMQLKHLQAQISPHFMYNTYYTLYRLIQDERWDSSRQLALLLGEFYQYITRSGNMEKTLREEVQHTLTYVEIQTMRFPTSIQEIETLPEEIAGMIVPQLILQPLFENVFQHAREHLHAGESLHFAMRYEVLDDRVQIYVENNGDLSDETIRHLQESLQHADEQKETTGLLNIHKRLQLYYSEEAGLRVSRSRLNGLCVCMVLLR